VKRRYKILGALGIFLAVLAGALGFALSHSSPCAAAPPLAAGATRMKAIVYRCYGPPQVLRYEDIARPTPADDEVLVRVHAASVNPLDWHYLEGIPYIVRLFDSGLGRPESPRMGVDFAGTVEAVGRQVTHFKAGDEVFGGRHGAFAEYVTIRESRALAPKPAQLSFDEAAAVPIAALTALQALRDAGQLRAGQRVLIIGASGGVGTFAVQIAKSYGAQVTGVCSTRNVELVRSLGADQVIDYTREDFLNSGEHFDLILDNVGNRSFAGLLALRRLLTPGGRAVLIGGGGPADGRWIGALSMPLEAWIISPFISQKFEMMFADLTPADLNVMAELMQSGKVTAVIDRRYALADTAAALAYLEQGHARGKVIITVP